MVVGVFDRLMVEEVAGKCHQVRLEQLVDQGG